jgi:hypothetical protein
MMTRTAFDHRDLEVRDFKARWPCDHRDLEVRDFKARWPCDHRDLEVRDFKARWPCSGLPEAGIGFTFDKDNNIVDISPPATDQASGDTLIALMYDAINYAKTRR